MVNCNIIIYYTHRLKDKAYIQAVLTDPLTQCFVGLGYHEAKTCRWRLTKAIEQVLRCVWSFFGRNFLTQMNIPTKKNVCIIGLVINKMCLSYLYFIILHVDGCIAYSQDGPLATWEQAAISKLWSRQKPSPQGDLLHLLPAGPLTWSSLCELVRFLATPNRHETFKSSSLSLWK